MLMEFLIISEFMKEIFMTRLYLYQYQLKSKNIVDIDTNEIKLELEKLGLIPQNKRNIKNPNKIKKFTET